MKDYEALLFYGFQTDFGNGEVYHAFEVADPNASTDDEAVGKKLAGLLDTTPDDEDFACKSMFVKLPASLVESIQRDTINRLMRDAGGKEQAYELFKLWWMIVHGKTLKDLMTELFKLQCEELDAKGETFYFADHFYEEWERERGFGGSIWPCFEEFGETEYVECF